MTELRQRAVREDAPPEDKVEASLSAEGRAVSLAL